MSVNLIKLIMDQITPDLLGKAALSLGVPREGVQGGLAGAVPALLSGLIGVAEQPGGADRLMTAVKDQQQREPDLLSSLGSILGGSGQSGLIQEGSSVIAGLLGSGAASGLASAVARFAGIGDGPAKSLIGLAAPLVMGVLGKQVTASGYDAGGLATLLAGQKGNVADAMPKGFADLLRGPSPAVAGQPIQATTTAPPRSVPAEPRATVSRPAAGGGWVRWAWIPVAFLAAWFAWQYFGQRPTEPARVETAPATSPSTAPATAASLVVDGVDLGERLKSIVGGLTTDLGSIKDAAAAKAALPKLEEAASGLDALSASAGKLPTAVLASLAAIAGPAATSVRQAVDATISIPGVGDMIKPVMDRIVVKLDTLAKA
jgi:hypothetical protein